MAERLSGYLTSDEAAAALAVKKATLYTYASRGMIRLAAAPDGKRRLYLAEDVERLRSRAAAHRGQGAAAAGALRWGEPVVDSAITLIDPDGPNYRGIPALELVEKAWTWEQAAELLWTGEIPTNPPVWASPKKAGIPLVALAGLVPVGTPPIGTLTVLNAALGAADPLAVGCPPAGVHKRARVLARRLTAGLSAAAPRHEDWRERFNSALAAPRVAVALCRAAGLEDAHADDVDTALVLCADHELNASAFGARVAAGAGADLYNTVGAALSVLSGPRHGAASERVEQLLADVDHPSGAKRVLAQRLRTGTPLPGFGHPLYGRGDPRAEPLIARARTIGGAHVDTCNAMLEAVRDAGHPPPNVDFGLVALAGAIGLPRGWASALFAIGRLAGWVAHGLEQQEQGVLLRPRARYTGP